MATRNPLSRLARTAARGGVILLVVLYYFFNLEARNGFSGPLEPRADDYYNLLVRGLVQGKPWLDVKADPVLLAAADPYDPATRPAAVTLHDASYFKGHYYIYFGVVPALVLYLPTHWLTHQYLEQSWATFIFVSAGFAFAAAAWMIFVRRGMLRVSIAIEIVGLLVLGAGSMTPVLLGRPGIWEVAVAAGYCFSSLAVLCNLLAIVSPRRLWFSSGAALALGAAVGSRPTYIVAASLLVLTSPSLMRWFATLRGPRRGGRDLVHLVPATLFGLTLLLLLGYNYIRFENPFEFGMSYALTSVYERRQSHFNTAYIYYNFRAYFLSPLHWGAYFPFVRTLPTSGPPDHYYGSEEVMGALWNLPFCLFSLGIIPAFLARNERTRIARAFARSLLLLSIPTAGIVLCFYASTGRYMVDFIPALMLLSCVGLAVAFERARSFFTNALLVSAAAMLGLYTVGTNTLLSVQLYDVLRSAAPTLYTRCETFFNRPAYRLQKLLGAKYAPVQLQVHFRASPSAGIIPVLATGAGDTRDLLAMRYLPDSRVQFIFSHGALWTVESAPHVVAAAGIHTLHVQMGSFYPPLGTPFYDRMNAYEVASLYSWLEVAVDGTTVFDSEEPFFHWSGNAPVIDARAFAGRPAVTRPPPIARDRRSDFSSADFALDLELPNDPADVPRPILSSGPPRLGNVLAVKCVAPGKVQFIYDQWGGGPSESPVITVDPARLLHRLVVHLPSPPETGTPTDRSVVPAALALRLDDRFDWRQSVLARPALSYERWVGRNLVESTAAASQYITPISISGRPAEDLSKAPRTIRRFENGTLTLHLRLPSGRESRVEPLIVVGTPGKADFVVVQYIRPNEIRFGLDHWGRKMQWSDPIAADFSQPHEIKIVMPTLKPDLPAAPTVAGNLSVTLDGTEAWHTASDFYIPEPGEISLLENPAGGSSTENNFTGLNLDNK